MQQRKRNGRNSAGGAFTSTCGLTRIRGHARQIAQRYDVMAKEAEHEVEAELYKQHAEHYYRQYDIFRKEREEQHAAGSVR